MSAVDDAADQAKTCAKNSARNCGYAVFPVAANKRPTLNNGFHGASIDPDEIDQIWHDRPGPLVGIATGEASGIDVLDIDVEHSTAPRWLEVARKRMPPTRTFATRRGGHHLYFQHAAGVRNSQSKLAHGVDVRGDGGYIIHWFSAGFACEDHTPPAAWPDWLLQCVTWKPEPQSARTERAVVSGNSGKVIDGLLSFVSAAREGERNRSLFWAATRIDEQAHAGRVARREALGLLVSAALSAGLSQTEAERTIASAWRG